MKDYTSNTNNDHNNSNSEDDVYNRRYIEHRRDTNSLPIARPNKQTALKRKYTRDINGVVVSVNPIDDDFRIVIDRRGYEAIREKAIEDHYSKIKLAKLQKISKILIVATKLNTSYKKRLIKQKYIVLKSAITPSLQNKNRFAVICLALLFSLSALYQPFLDANWQKPIELNSEILNLVGDSRDDTKDYLKYDTKTKQHNYIAEPIDASEGPSQHVGRVPDAYSMTLPDNAKDGVTVTEKNSKIGITLAPEFFTTKSKKSNGDHLVYQSGSRLLVYTLKYNGLKEDIIIPEFQGESLYFDFKLTLPIGVEARLDSEGNIGIFSADSTLFGDISFGTDEDRKKIDIAREKSEKNNLVMTIPYPVIFDSLGREFDDRSNFELSDKTTVERKETRNPNLPADIPDSLINYNEYKLSIKSNNLKNLTYPISIDPTIQVKGTADFTNIKNESGIDIDTSNNTIKRGALTGGTTDSWTNDTVLPSAVFAATAVVYGDYLYNIGGCGAGSCASASDTVNYTKINSSGAFSNPGCGTVWCPTTVLPAERRQAAAVAYNGYIYVSGGANSAGTLQSTVYYGKIKPSDGSVISWNTTSSLAGGTRNHHGSVASNGHVYVVGGGASSSNRNTQYAKINADGTLTAFANTGSNINWQLSGQVTVYNNKIYTAGGYDGSNSQSTVQYATINADGTLSSFVSNPNSLQTARQASGLVAYNGYLYTISGISGTSIIATNEYAQILADGSVGPWSFTTALSAGRSSAPAIGFKNRIYTLGGCTTVVSLACTAVTAQTQKTTIDPAGYIRSYTANTSLTIATGIAAHASYNGCLYMMGGITSTNNYNNTSFYSCISNTAGTLNSWSPSAIFASARVSACAIAHNGFMYLLGGTSAPFTGLNDIQIAPINSSGSLGAWAISARTLSSLNGTPTCTIHNGYLYVMGGVNCVVTTCSGISTVEYFPINSDGTLGARVSSGNLPSASSGQMSTVVGNKLYVYGGDGNLRHYSTIAGDGSLGAYIPTPSLLQTHTNTGMFSYNGYMYIGAGFTPGSPSNKVEYAIIDNNGVVGNWSYMSDLNISVGGNGFMAMSGYMYFVGGCTSGGPNSCTGSRTAETYSAPINNGGTGALNWSSTTSTISASVSSPGTAVYNGRIYRVGGFQGGASSTSTVQSGLINADGTVTWSSEPALVVQDTCNQGLYGESLAVYANQLFAIGGGSGNCGAGRREVFRASIDPSTGRLKTNADNSGAGFCLNDGSGNYPWCYDEWIHPSNFTESAYRMMYGFAQYGNTVYVIGGLPRDSNTQNPFADYWRTTINNSPTGNNYMSPWTIVTNNSLPTVRYGMATAQWRDYLYVIGGATQDGANGGSANNYGAVSDVLYTKLSPSAADGTGMADPGGCTPISGTHWCKGASMPFSAFYASAFIANGFLTVANGNTGNGSSGLAQTYSISAPIGADGSIGKWSAGVTALSLGLTASGSAYYNGRFYIIGGANFGGGYSNLEQHSTVASIQRTGSFSKAFDFDVGVKPTKLITRGTKQSGAIVGVNYSNNVACGATAYDQDQTVSDTGYGGVNAQTFNLGTSRTLARCLYLRYTIDDSLSAVFPDSGNETSISSFDIYYTANPGNRLRGGRTFTNGSDRGLDAPF